jgi:hypothetical protein
VLPSLRTRSRQENSGLCYVQKVYRDLCFLITGREYVWYVEKRRKNTENMLPELITAIEIISRGYTKKLSY